MNFLQDLDDLTMRRLEERGYQAKSNDDAYKRFTLLNILTTRHILPISYEVKVSKQLLENPQYGANLSILKEITQRLQNGENLLPYLSKAAPDPNKRDELLSYWGIHHLHLNSIKTIDADGFVERKRGKAQLLFIKIEGSVAHLIDIRPHDKNIFEDIQLLEIVDQNWPHLHHAVNATGNTLTTETIKKFKKLGINCLMKINGRSIMPSMVLSGGVPMHVHFEYRVLRDELTNFEKDVRNRFYEYFPCRQFVHPAGIPIPDIRLISLDAGHFLIQDKNTGQTCQARR